MEAASDHEQNPETPSIHFSKAVFTVQSRLLDLSQCSESQLLAASFLLSRRDYDDLVTERSLACVCGFPRCPNPVSAAPAQQDRRFRISRRERRIYHLRDISRFCSTSCCNSSTAFAATLLADARTAGPTPSRIADILVLFQDNPPLSAPADRVLAILEKTGPSAVAGEVTLGAWLGPADAVEGHVVPTRERSQASPKLPPGDISDLDDKMRHCSISPLVVKASGELKFSLRKPGAGGEEKRAVKWADEEKGSSSLGSLKAIAAANEVEQVAPLEVEDDVDDSKEVDAEAGAGGEGSRGVRWATEEMGSLSLGSLEASAAVNDEELEEPPEEDDGDNDSEEVETESEDDGPAFERCCLKWPTKPVPLGAAMFDAEDSWYDAPPEGFHLSLSTFATMWKALFGWVTCSSVAYIYGKSEDCRDEFLCIDGREYPTKVTLSDGRSVEIKRTLAGCLARALPNVVSKLRLPMPISTLEMAVGQLLETMMFIEALPPFSTKEWNVVVLLFLDALSVSRVANLSSHMVNKKVLMDAILETAQIRRDEYETMKDLMIPLGRLPQFAVQSGA